MPTISVIIPTYNAERSILETIESVRKQTFSNFELIVIDDGSTDRTLELLSSVVDERIKVFPYENAGGPIARNRGIFRATGEFLTFLDHDDLWTPDKLELQLAALQQHPDAGVAYSWTYYLQENGESFHAGEPLFFEGNVYCQLLVKNFLDSGSNPLIRKTIIEVIGGFDPEFPYCADWEFYLRLAEHCKFIVVPKHQIFYRQSSGSMSSKIESMEDFNVQACEKLFESVPPELQYLKQQSLAHIYQELAHLCLVRISDAGGAKQASQKLQKAIRLYPRILLNKKTLTLAIKLLLIRVLSPKIASHLLQLSSKNRASRIQCSNNERVLLS